jgi:hypothetical protein
VKPSHGDYKPSGRRRHVPSGRPRRRIPLIRVALLLALAAFLYTRFDAYGPRLRQALSPLSLRLGMGDRSRADGRDARRVAAKWSPDSSLLALDCPRGLAGACCDTLDRASPGLCGEATALRARAAWSRLLGKPATPEYLRLQARVAPDAPTRRLALSGLSGRDARGGFLLRRRDADGAWCDASRGCLESRPDPVDPLSGAKLEAVDGDGAATWVSASPWVRAALPGRVAAVDSAGGGVLVRVYHGYELYTVYGPLQAAPGVRPGAIVTAGSHLGDAPARGALHALAVRVRQAGRVLDAAAFWGVRLSEAAGVGDAGGAGAEAVR